MLRSIASLAVVVAVIAAPAFADTVVYTGDTTGGPLWDRPIGAGPSISGLGPVNYDVQEFIVDADGAYDMSSVQQFDGYLHLYEGSFDPADQLTNLIAGNDDGSGGIGTSEILGQALTAGADYYLITSGFQAGDAGFFENTISGPGMITLVPEPASLALLALGTLTLIRRR